MKALLTTPAKYVYYALATDATMMFGLAHLATGDSQLCDWYARTIHHASSRLGAYLIIDNGLMERGEAMSFGDMRFAAAKVAADEVILPDVYKDAEATRDCVQDALTRIEHDGEVPFNCMAVIHEQIADDLARTLEEWAKHSAITAVGVPKYYTSALRWPQGRISVLKVIKRLGLHTRFKVHLLGVQDDILEVQTIARGFPWVRSVDTSWPIMAGLKGIDITQFPTHKIDYEPDPKGTPNTAMVLRNIQTYQYLVSGE